MVFKKKDKSKGTKSLKLNSKDKEKTLTEKKIMSEDINNTTKIKSVLKRFVGRDKQEKVSDRDLYEEMGVVEKLLFKKKEKILIKMSLRNGNQTEFYVSPKNNYFTFRNGTYILVQDFLDYDESAKSHFSIYHEDCALPFRNKITITDFYSAIESDEDANNSVAQAINPANLLRFQKGTLIEQTMSGSKLEDNQRMQLFLSIATVFILVFILVIVIYNTGAFN